MKKGLGLAEMQTRKHPLTLPGLCAFIPFPVYLAFSIFYFGAKRDWTNWYLGSGRDPINFIWFFDWWPFSISHGLNPFQTYYAWFPKGYNLAWATSVPFPALLALPVTFSAGPILSYNLLMLLAPALAAWTAFLLANELTQDKPASFIGGYLFGFSSYECGQMLGHLNLTWVFLVPLAVLLCVRRVRGKLERKYFIPALAVLLLLQLGISIEVFATLCVMGALTWCICLLFAPADDRGSLLKLPIDILFSLIMFSLFALPFLYYVFKGRHELPTDIIPPAFYSTDLLNYIIPTAITRFGGTILSPLSNKFTSGISEQGAYLGVPLILILLFYFRSEIGLPYVRALFLTLVLIAVFSLGPCLQIGGINTKFPLPWSLAADLPLIKAALPMRFSMFVALCSGVAVALWLANVKSGFRRPLRFAVSLAACLCLLPAAGVPGWTQWPEQGFFSPQHIKQALGPKPNVLILPFGQNGPGMAWQLNAAFTFTQSGGYIGFPPARELGWSSLNQLFSGLPDQDFAADFPVFCKIHKINFILIGQGAPTPLVAAITKLGWASHDDSGIEVITVPDLSALKYHYVLGDYWASPAPLNFMGHSIDIVTNHDPAILTISGKYRAVTAPVDVVVANQTGQTQYSVNQQSTIKITLPADATTTVTASKTFIPDSIVHNGDQRNLSVLISLESSGGTNKLHADK